MSGWVPRRAVRLSFLAERVPNEERNRILWGPCVGPVMSLPVARLVALGLAAAHFIIHVDNIRFYDACATAWQLTLWSMHAAPIVAFRLHMADDGPWPSSHVLVSGVAWLLISLRCRRLESISNAWSRSFIFIELSALLMPLSPRFLSALLLLQCIIVGGFWLGMAVASFSATFTFLPLDRHLHRGLRHMLTSREAQRRLAHDLGGHGLQQGLFASALHAHVGTAWPPTAATMVDTVGLMAAYAAIVLLTCWICPPHVLPYVNLPLRGGRPRRHASRH